jgi:site-specific DNA-methyltransferase (adenine-specific)
MINTIICGDGLENIKKLEDNSIDLICIDPPYNINKDKWDTIDNYFDWLESYFIEFERILKDTGSFFIFHNNFRSMATIDSLIEENTSFIQKNFIVWNKRFDSSVKKGFLDGYVIGEKSNHSFQKMSEYIMFYQFELHHKLKKRRKELGFSQERITMEIPSKNGKRTGWYSNIENGLSFPNERTIIPIKKHLGLDLCDLVPKFRNQKTHHSVWNYELDHKKIGHITPKPVNLIKNIIEHTTDVGDIVLDCFGGSGTLAVACKELNRNFIVIEKEQKYCDIANARII